MNLRDFHLFSFLSGRVLFLVRVVIGTFTFELLDLQKNAAYERSMKTVGCNGTHLLAFLLLSELDLIVQPFVFLRDRHLTQTLLLVGFALDNGRGIDALHLTRFNPHGLFLKRAFSFNTTSPQTIPPNQLTRSAFEVGLTAVSSLSVRFRLMLPFKYALFSTRLIEATERCEKTDQDGFDIEHSIRTWFWNVFVGVGVWLTFAEALWWYVVAFLLFDERREMRWQNTS